MDKRTRLYAQLLDASKERRETNIAEHKLRTGRIKRSLGARRKLRETKKEAKVSKVPLDFLAIGDSWFEYPLYNEVLSFQNNAIVAKSQLGSKGNPPPQILNQALHGQATTATLSWENQDKMITVLQDPDQWLNEETHLPDAILVAGEALNDEKCLATAGKVRRRQRRIDGGAQASAKRAKIGSQALPPDMAIARCECWRPQPRSTQYRNGPALAFFFPGIGGQELIWRFDAKRQPCSHRC
jgi:hypothetical protein